MFYKCNDLKDNEILLILNHTCQLLFKQAIQEFIKSLDMISDEDKLTLLEPTPSSHIGFAAKIVEDEL